MHQGDISPAEAYQRLAERPGSAVVIDPRTNTNGHVLAPGFAYDLPAGGYFSLTFNVQTYPVLQALVDRDFEQVREFLYDKFPDLRAAGGLDGGVEDLATVNPLFYAIFSDPRVQVIDDAVRLYAPFQFNVVAAATPMTRDEFVAFQTEQALALRDAILNDGDALPALLTLAGDADQWVAAYLAALEDAGILRPEDEAPQIRESAAAVSMVSTLGMGLLIGPAGDQIRTSGDLVEFFAKVREWYGDDPALEVAIARLDLRESQNVPPLDIPVPELPVFEDYDLGLSNATQFQTYNVFAPWLDGDTLAEVGSDASTGDLTPLDLGRYLQEIEAAGRDAAVVGPQGYGEAQYLPASTPLPYEVRFSVADGGSQPVGEVRVVTQLDSDLDVRTFRLGSLRIGDITINVPAGRASFQTDLDLTATHGFVFRVSAGADVESRTVSWLLQAIDPDTGEVISDGVNGLFKSDASGDLATGMVSYSIEADRRAADGAVIEASARVLFDTRAPQDTNTVSQTLDAVAPVTALEVTPIDGAPGRFDVAWEATDAGSGVRHVTVYVAENGGDFRIWLKQSTDTGAVFEGEAGVAYEFLALATDNAGNVEAEPVGVSVPGDGYVANLGGAVFDDTTSPAPLPAVAPVGGQANDLFIEAGANVPAPRPSVNPSAYDIVVSPFAAAAFARGFFYAKGAAICATK